MLLPRGDGSSGNHLGPLSLSLLPLSLLALSLLARPALADEPLVEIRAARAEADLDGRRAELEGGVCLRHRRFRLDAERLTVERLPDGRLEVSGPLRVSACPCDDPPLSADVDSASLSPSGDLTLRGATARAFGVPFFYTPWLLVRPESSPGLLPPRLAFRGHDGLLLGAGAHLPAGGASLDLEPAAYLKGGHELLARARLGPLDARLRWDHRSTDLLSLSSRGTAGQTDEGAPGAAWDVDVIRGPRARSGSIELDPASRAYDRAAASALFPLGGTLSLGARGSLARGTGEGFVGPRASFGASASPSPGSSLSAAADASSLAGPDGSLWHAGRLEGRGYASMRKGPAVLEAEASAGGAAMLHEERPAHDVFALARAGARAPLARRFGETMHVVEPRAALLAAAGSISDQAPASLGRPIPASRGAALAPLASLATRLGSPTAGAASAEAGFGALVGREAPRPLARASVSAEAPWLLAQADASAAGDARSPDATLLASASLGPRGGPRLGASLEGLRGLSPVEVRALASGPLPVASSGALASPGWSASGHAVVPLGSSVTATAWAAADASSWQWLAARGRLAYQHPCGCLSAALDGGRRLGREGTDIWLTVALSP